MARVFIDDCTTKISDRFELVAVAAERAKEIINGAALVVQPEGDKVTVIALREIASGKLNFEDINSGIVRGFRERGILESAGGEGAAELEFIENEIMGSVVDASSTRGLNIATEEELEGAV